MFSIIIRNYNSGLVYDYAINACCFDVKIIFRFFYYSGVPMLFVWLRLRSSRSTGVDLKALLYWLKVKQLMFG